MSQTKKILIVDDSKVSRMLIRRMVAEQRPGWLCSEAGGGSEALAEALNTVFDYATVDVNMPGMDGLELTRRFREECPQLRVCLLTANFQEDTRRLAETYQAGFLRKPITEEGIANAISFFEQAS